MGGRDLIKRLTENGDQMLYTSSGRRNYKRGRVHFTDVRDGQLIYTKEMCAGKHV